MMTNQQHLLLLLMEECNEVAQAASKVVRFTADHAYLPDGDTNLQTLAKEYNDLLAVVEMLEDAGLGIYKDHSMIGRKKERVHSYMRISRELNQLEAADEDA